MHSTAKGRQYRQHFELAAFATSRASESRGWLGEPAGARTSSGRGGRCGAARAQRICA